jgi:rhamnogalacturonan endolyase
MIDRAITLNLKEECGVKQKTKLTIAIVLGTILLISGSTYAQRYMENLGRGMVAVNQGSGNVYVGWRMLGTDPNDIAFNLYRNDTKVNSEPITNSTNYVDDNGSTSALYHVRAVINGQEQGSSKAVEVWDQQYLTIPLQVPSGYTPGDASVGDLDGDGEYEIVLKWEDSPQDNSISGFTNSPILDAYKLDGTLMWRIDLGINIREGAHYTQFMVYDLDSDGRAEVACKTAPGTVDGQGNYVILPGDDPNADYRNASGYILDGPEYLTVFDGLTGAELATTNYIPPRGNVSDWGDDYGNRVDRFLACIAYLDGVRPSLVMCRGYYTWTWLVAWDWRDGQLTHRWTFNSRDGTPGNLEYEGQGNHNLSVGDVDGDGKDEIIYGACAIDDDGTGLYNTGLGHGDAMHLSDMDPDRPGLEVWDAHESYRPIGGEFREAGTGQLIWGKASTGDVGRAVAGNILAGVKGYQMWAAGGVGGLYDRYGSNIGRTPSSNNFLIWWDGDVVRELLDSNHIDKYGLSSDTRLLTASDCSSINGTKSTPCLSADILGDWREEVIWKTITNNQLRIYMTTIPTDHRIYTLMHDPQYRLSIAWQNVAYNQPPHTGFYLGDGMAEPPRPDIRFPEQELGLYGDFTGDDIVDMNDIPYFTDFWLDDDCNETAELDLNDDCIINFYEFSALAENWLIADTTAPLAPTGLSATAGDGTVSLDWNNNSESDLDGYNIYRSTTSGSGYGQLNGSLLSSSNYTDNSVTNGATYYYVVTAVDASSNESNYSSEVSAAPCGISSITIQEDTTGFCNVDGTIDDNHSGFTGTGFANTTNATGMGVDWRINIQSSGGTYTFTWRFANGSSSRPARLLVNGSTVVSSIDFPATGAWTTWSEVSVDVTLTTGIKDIRLEATGSNGLANIDYLMVTGCGPEAANCM